MSKRVVVTGVGMVSPLGVGKEAFFSRLFKGDCGISEIQSFDTSRFPCRMGAEVIQFNPKEFISSQNLRKMDRISRFAVASARMAMEEAGLKVDTSNRDRIGIVLGVAHGSIDVSIQFAKALFTDGPGMVYPILVPNTVMNAPAGHTSIELGFRGVNSTVNHNEASAETAIAYATAEIMKGTADVMLAGGVDIVAEFFYDVMVHFKALSGANGGEEKARPFDINRNGFIIGEGAGIICLESLEHARARGAIPYCEVKGWGMSSSPSTLTDWPSDPKGPILAIMRALRSSGIGPDSIDYICASANGGKRLDILEAEAIGNVFGERGERPYISSIKGAIGESFSSGGIRATSLAISIKEGLVPPTLGLRDPIKPLSFVVDKGKMSLIRNGLLNGISSGGTYISLVFAKMEDGEEKI